MKETDTSESMKYYREIRETIQVTGSNKMKLGNRKALKHSEADLLREVDSLNDAKRLVNSGGLTMKEREEKEHDFFCKLLGYINEYKASICYDTSGLINLNSQKYDENDILEQQRTEKYSSANIFPLQEDGPEKGKFTPIRDERGNIVVDPASLVSKDPFFIDYHLYNRFKKLAESGKLMQQPTMRSKKKRAEIKKLFGYHEPAYDPEHQLTDLQKYTQKKSITKQIIGK